MVGARRSSSTLAGQYPALPRNTTRPRPADGWTNSLAAPWAMPVEWHGWDRMNLARCSGSRIVFPRLPRRLPACRWPLLDRVLASSHGLGGCAQTRVGSGLVGVVAAREARSKISQACSRSPRVAASLASFPHVSMNDGMALGSSTAPPISIAFARREIAALGALAARAVTGCGAPVVRGKGSAKDEGRDPPVTRAESRPSESGRQDLNLRPLGPEDPPWASDMVGSLPPTTDVLGTTVDRAGDPSDTSRPYRLDPAASGTIQAQRTLGAPRLLTVREVALRFRVSRATVYRLVAEGRIPALRVSSGAVRIPEAALLPRQNQQSR